MQRQKGGLVGGGVHAVAPTTIDQVAAARATCARMAVDADDLAMLLDMLAIGPDWPKRWAGPIGDLGDGGAWANPIPENKRGGSGSFD